MVDVTHQLLLLFAVPLVCCQGYFGLHGARNCVKGTFSHKLHHSRPEPIWGNTKVPRLVKMDCQ